MANVSEWSANELENLYLDDMNLSDERGRRAAKIMAAVKAKEDEQDAKLNAIAGGLVFRGTKATYADLEAVTDPAVGDMYSVTALGGENYAWTGEAWDALGTSDANVVHIDKSEKITGAKTFLNSLKTTVQNFVLGTAPEQNASAGYYMHDEASPDSVAVGGCFFIGETDGDTAISLQVKSNPIEEGQSATWRSVRLEVDPSVSGVAFVPSYNNNIKLGTASLKWAEVFCANGTINTSDERLKTKIKAFPKEVLDAWEEVEFVQFQFADAVTSKGKSARLHCGMIAQRIDDAFKRHGLDAGRYGLFCHDEWAARPEVRNADGEVVEEALPAGDAYSLRYGEALCLEAACQRRRAERAEKRLSEIEARLAALEGRIDGIDK